MSAIIEALGRVDEADNKECWSLRKVGDVVRVLCGSRVYFSGTEEKALVALNSRLPADQRVEEETSRPPTLSVLKAAADLCRAWERIQESSGKLAGELFENLREALRKNVGYSPEPAAPRDGLAEALLEYGYGNLWWSKNADGRGLCWAVKRDGKYELDGPDLRTAASAILAACRPTKEQVIAAVGRGDFDGAIGMIERMKEQTP